MATATLPAKTKPDAKTVTVQEAFSDPKKVDREAGIIRGVKIIGLDSLHGRHYPAEVLEAAKHLYEGVRVNVNHVNRQEGVALCRDYRDKLGNLQNVSAAGDGLYGDLHYNPRHQVAEQLAWDAEHDPKNVGLSHNADIQESFQDGRLTASKIDCVHSVDLVSKAATTRGIFESDDMSIETPVAETVTPETPADPGSPDPLSTAMDGLCAQLTEIFHDDSMDEAAKIAKAKDVIKKSSKLKAIFAADGDDAPTSGEGGPGGAMTPTEEGAKPTIANLQATIRGLENREKAREMLAAAGIGPGADDESRKRYNSQVSAVSVMEGDDNRKALIQTWSAGNSGAKPPIAKPKSTPAQVQEGGGGNKPPAKADPVEFAQELLAN